MAVRTCLYTMLLYQDLIARKQLYTTKSKHKQLPPILPIVLYNGKKRWDSRTQIQDLIVDLPKGFEKYQPQFQYLLLDEGTFKNSELEPLKNLVAAIFRLENAKNPHDVSVVIELLTKWLKSPEQDRLRRSFVIWIKRVLITIFQSLAESQR